ncbi:hypothetical protein MRX96_000393 [Rhipicephalus microplus]
MSRFMFRCRRTPVKEGKSPAERLLGYEMRTKLDCILPTTQDFRAKPRNEQEQRWPYDGVFGLECSGYGKGGN